MQDYILRNITPFDLGLTLDCGQAFRWKKCEDGSFEGIAMGKYLRLSQNGNDLIFHNTSKEDFENIWFAYFDFGRDYGKVIDRANKDSRIAPMTKVCGGIRILRQSPWEALCSFIISQNNNIPRIKGIIERLCESFGDPIEKGYTFPTPEKLKDLCVEDLAPLRSGFRAKYILDAAKKCCNVLDLEYIKTLPIDKAREQLMTITGVGPKVADCTMLYGMGFAEAFPMDVWMKKAMTTIFSDGFPEDLNDCAGIVQQYIFHYIRTGSGQKTDKN